MVNQVNKKMGKLFIVSAPSGAGKTSIVSEVLARMKNDFDISRIVTYTSRTPRVDEKNGHDYVFVSKHEFENKVQNGFFLETNEYAGHLYGSPRPDASALAQGKSYILVLDINGAKAAAKEFVGAVCIWINAPDVGVLKKRLQKRGSEDEKQIKARLDEAEQEMHDARHSRLFSYLIINDTFEQAVNEFILLVKKELGL